MRYSCLGPLERAARTTFFLGLRTTRILRWTVEHTQPLRTLTRTVPRRLRFPMGHLSDRHFVVPAVG